MPVKVEARGQKFRIVESETGQIALNASGTAADGGGHNTEAAAKLQARAINASKEEKD